MKVPHERIEGIEDRIFDLLVGHPKRDCLCALLTIASALATDMADGHPQAASELFRQTADALAEGPHEGPLN